MFDQPHSEINSTMSITSKLPTVFPNGMSNGFMSLVTGKNISRADSQNHVFLVEIRRDILDSSGHPSIRG